MSTRGSSKKTLSRCARKISGGIARGICRTARSRRATIRTSASSRELAGARSLATNTETGRGRMLKLKIKVAKAENGEYKKNGLRFDFVAHKKRLVDLKPRRIKPIPSDHDGHGNLRFTMD